MAEQIRTALAILRLKQVMAETGLSRSRIYERATKEGTFPPAIKLGARSVGWRRGDVDAWLADPAGYRAPVAA